VAETDKNGVGGGWPKGEHNVNPRNPIDQELLEALSNKSFVLDCPEIVLTQNAAVTPEVIRGRGSISLLDRPHFELKMFADPGTHRFRDVNEMPQGLSGTLVPESDYYNLCAKDLGGDIWSWERLLIKRSGVESVIIRAEVPRLKHVSRCKPESRSLALVFFDQPGVVYNRYVKRTTTVADESNESIELRAAIFQTPQFDVQVEPIHGIENGLSMHLTFKALEPSAGVEHRVVEALGFATFRPVSWSLCVKSHAGLSEVTLAPRTAFREGPLYSPVPTHPLKDARAFWGLFAAYLNHVIRFTDSEHYAPLSARLRPLIHLDTQELVVLALLLCVAVEGVLNLEFKELAEPTEEFKTSVESAQTAIQGLTGVDPGILKRIRMPIDAMKSARADDKLRSLLGSGFLTVTMFRAWKSLRNATAHASITPQSHNTEKLYSQCNCVAALLNLLVFQAIGYVGEYVDFSTPGWPERSFPPASPASPPGDAGGGP
jgi:hypothetical protein